MLLSTIERPFNTSNINKFVLLFFAVFCKKPYPEDTAEVSIARIIIIPYKKENKVPVFFAIKSIGISILLILSTLPSKLRIAKPNVKIKQPLIEAIPICCFLPFEKFLSVIKIGISVILL